MDFEIRADGVLHIEGYVNAVERDSRIVMCPECGKCVEQIAAGAFGNALRAAKNVDMLFNHDKGRKIGSTSEGTLTLTEDSIGLRASADITDEEVVEKARNGLLRGWSFGFKATDTEIEQRSQGVPRRHVKALSISEVSLVDSRYRPCYAGTSIELRADEEGAEEADFTELRFDTLTCEKTEPDTPDYSSYEARLARVRMRELELRAEELELRFNPYHDPQNGRFTTANGGGSGSGFLYSKGGKSFYVLDSKEFKQRINPHQQKAIDRMNEVLSKDKTVSKMPEYTILNSGNIGFEYEKTEIYTREKGGKMIDPLKADTIERISKVSGTILIDDSGNRRIFGKKHNTISEKVIKKGSSSKGKGSSAQGSLKVSTYVINAGTSSQHFGLKDGEGNVLHAPNKWKTEKGALNWAKKNGWT